MWGRCTVVPDADSDLKLSLDGSFLAIYLTDGEEELPKNNNYSLAVLITSNPCDKV